MFTFLKNNGFYLTIIFVMLTISLTIFLFQDEGDNTKIEIALDQSVQKDDLKVLISPYRKLQCSFENAQSFDDLHQFVVLFNDGEIQDYHDKGISNLKDFYIYAKYKNQYARIKYKNTKLSGQENTVIKLSFDPKSMNGKAFKDKLSFSKNIYDKQLINKLDEL